MCRVVKFRLGGKFHVLRSIWNPSQFISSNFSLFTPLDVFYISFPQAIGNESTCDADDFIRSNTWHLSRLLECETLNVWFLHFLSHFYHLIMIILHYIPSQKLCLFTTSLESGRIQVNVSDMLEESENVFVSLQRQPDYSNM